MKQYIHLKTSAIEIWERISNFKYHYYFPCFCCCYYYINLIVITVVIVKIVINIVIIIIIITIIIIILAKIPYKSHSHGRLVQNVIFKKKNVSHYIGFWVPKNSAHIFRWDALTFVDDEFIKNLLYIHDPGIVPLDPTIHILNAGILTHMANEHYWVEISAKYPNWLINVVKTLDKFWIAMTQLYISTKPNESSIHEPISGVCGTRPMGTIWLR